MEPFRPVLERYPKSRPALPAPYQKIYEEHYTNNRNGETPASFFSSRLEAWMHKKAAEDVRSNPNLITLEIGAGTLNQLKYEPTRVYDIVEPFRELYCSSSQLSRIRRIYPDIGEVPADSRYDRITSIAAFEHICNLPEVVERCKSLLAPGGCLRAAIPNEGRFLWKLAYKMTTGLEFRLRYGLDYSVLMDYEHVNTADEVEAVLMHFFPSVKMSLLGFNRDLAFYRYYECTG